MASRRSSSSSSSATDDSKQAVPTPRLGSTIDDPYHVALPGGSSAFKEVMNELKRPSTPPDPPVRSPRRRRSTHQAAHLKHMQFIPELKVDEDAEAVTTLKLGVRVVEEESEEDSEEEIGGPMILHGKCHCYFVKDGKVTGLADQKCHHEHRNHSFHPSPSSPIHRSPHTSPHPHRKFPPSSSSPSPDSGSPRARRKQQQQHASHHSTLFPPGMSEFRSRSHSDTTAMARISNSKRAASLTPNSITPPNNFNTARRGSRGAITDKPPSARKGSSLNNNKDVDDLAEGFSGSVRVSSPPSILVQEATVPDLAGASSSSDGLGPPDSYRNRVRRSSAHSIPSEQLHHLYDQFLRPGGGGSVASH